MTLSQKEIQTVKAQLMKQIEHLPQSQKLDAQQQINSLSPEAIEQLLREQQSKNPEKDNKPIFRKIVDRDIPSALIDENKDALAVLDIMPISNGHTLIIPKKAIRDAKQLPTSALSLAKKISKTLSKKLNAKSTQIFTEVKFGECIIDVVPSYDKELNLSSPRSQQPIETLQALAQKLRPIKRIPKVKLKTQSIDRDQLLKIKRRIP